jgi:hypothetical protein
MGGSSWRNAPSWACAGLLGMGIKHYRPGPYGGDPQNAPDVVPAWMRFCRGLSMIVSTRNWNSYREARFVGHGRMKLLAYLLRTNRRLIKGGKSGWHALSR